MIFSKVGCGLDTYPCCRVAAMSVSRRVAEEMDVELGQQVRYVYGTVLNSLSCFLFFYI